MLPIDIHLDKFIEWLESRNKIPKKQWQADLQEVAGKVAKAKAALPPKMKQLFGQSAIDYWSAKRIIAMLEKTKSDQGEKLRGLFGGYSDATLQEWDAIAKAYEKTNLYLAESGRILTRNVNNDIPSLRKALGEADRQANDLLRRHKESEQGAQRFLKLYNTACLPLGVEEGVTLRQGIENSKKRLPGLLTDVVHRVQSAGLKKAVAFYRNFACYTLNASYPDLDEEAHSGSLVPTAARVCDGGDLLVDQRRQDFVSDLAELSTFFMQRCSDIATSTIGSLPGAPANIQIQSESIFTSYLAIVEEVTAMLKDPNLQQLIMINKSERYVERTVVTVEQNLRHSQRLQKQATQQQAKRESLLKGSELNKRKLQELTKGTKELRALVEGAISQMYDGRAVNLFGDIASL